MATATQADAPNAEPFIDAREVARRIGVSYETLRRGIQAGALVPDITLLGTRKFLWSSVLKQLGPNAQSTASSAA